MQIPLRRPTFTLIAAVLLAAHAHAQSITLQDAIAFPSARTTYPMEEDPAIGYFELPTTDRVAHLVAKIKSGSVHLTSSGRSGYLTSLLSALDVPVESQVLIFLKTSLQRQFIDAKIPRVLFFTDDIVGGYIPGAKLIEIAVHDPQQGMIFYAIDQESKLVPIPERRNECANCHITLATMAVTGLLNRSIATREDGRVIPRVANGVVDHRTLANERWGGHYVTGLSGAAHLDNRAFTNVDSETLQDMRPLPPLDQVDLSAYIFARADADALMVFDHQMHMMNLITRIGWDARVAADQVLTKGLAQDNADLLIRSDARELVDYLLFVDEAAPPGEISPSAFARQFSQRGPRDRKGRSLYELDLTSWLMRYPCSYLIYSTAFEGLPKAAKAAVYARLWEVLSGKDRDRKYDRLAANNRKAITEILKDTKIGLPAYFN